MASIFGAIAFFLDAPMSVYGTMKTSSPNSDRIPLEERINLAKSDHPNLKLATFGVMIFILIGLHASSQDASWTTENVLFVFVAAMLACWSSRRSLGLILASICCVCWWCIDIQREPDFLMTTLRHLARAIAFFTSILLIAKARQSVDDAQRFARIDLLTGLPNRRAIIEALEAELGRLKRFNRSFSVAMIDCDGFKSINDLQGHLVGDRALQSIGSALRKQLRAYDSIGRLGGDEFVLVLPETSSIEISNIVDRVRSTLRTELHEDFPSLTVSIGVVTVRASSDPKSPPPSYSECLDQADQAMYAAKRSGPDQTHCKTMG